MEEVHMVTASVSADDLRLRGNMFYASGDLQAALDCFTQSLEIAKDVRTFGNRSHLHYLRGDFESALKDADDALMIEPENLKNIARRDRAKAEVAMDWVNNVLTGAGGNVVIGDDFCGPLQVFDSETKGRGMRTTRPVVEGELLLVSRPIVHCRSNSRAEAYKRLENELRKCCPAELPATKHHGGKDAVIAKVNDLFDGGKQESCNPRSDDLVGLARDIAGVLHFNAFQICQDSFALYHQPSFLNHSCCPNGVLVFVGSTFVLRAGRALAAQEEVSIRYFATLDLDLKARYTKTREWGFQCDCAVCRMERSPVWGDRLSALYAALSPRFSNLCPQFFQTVSSSSSGGGGDANISHRTAKLKREFDQAFKQVEDFISEHQRPIPHSKSLTAAEVSYVRSMFAGGYSVRRALCEYRGDVQDAIQAQRIVHEMQLAVEPGSFEQCKSCWLAEKFALAVASGMTMQQQHVLSSRVQETAKECHRIHAMRYGNDPRVLAFAVEGTQQGVIQSSAHEWTMDITFLS